MPNPLTFLLSTFHKSSSIPGIAEVNHLVEATVGQVEVGGGLVRHGPVEHPVEEGDIHVEVLR